MRSSNQNEALNTQPHERVFAHSWFRGGVFVLSNHAALLLIGPQWSALCAAMHPIQPVETWQWTELSSHATNQTQARNSKRVS